MTALGRFIIKQKYFYSLMLSSLCLLMLLAVGGCADSDSNAGQASLIRVKYLFMQEAVGKVSGAATTADVVAYDKLSCHLPGHTQADA